MKLKKTLILLVIFFIFIFILWIILLYFFKESNEIKRFSSMSKNNISLSNEEIINDEQKENRTLKVLVLEFDPYLETQGKKCSEYIGIKGDNKNLIYEVLDDLEKSSNGYIKIDPNYKETWIDTNEFPRYTCDIDIITGYDEKGNEITSKSRQLNEETWLKIMQNGWYEGMIHPQPGDPGYKDWYRYVDQIPEYTFDYEYVIDKYNLIERRNNGEFDWVFLSVIEPGKGNESNMVGKNAYWINGRAIEGYECDFFPIITGNPIRKDGILHNVGHLAENVMSGVFENSKFSYYENAIQISSEAAYDNLNLWDQYTLTKYAATDDSIQKFGVGNVHFPANAKNGEDEYGYWNEDYVYSNWKDWRYNYPNFKGEWELTNSSAWESEIPTSGCMDNTRLYQRWWFKNMPHVEGRNEEGYYNNWWKYILSLDYVTDIFVEENMQTLKIGNNDVTLKCECLYKSGIEEIVENNKEWTIEDTSIVEINSEGIIVGKKEGITEATFWRDGRKCSILLNVESAKVEEYNLSNCYIELENEEYNYTGKRIEPKVTKIVGLFENTIKEGEDYIVSYENNKDAGEAEVKIKGIGKYNGEAKTSFTIKPKKILIEVNDKQISYGEETPILDYKVSGEVENEKAGIEGNLKIINDGSEFKIGKEYIISAEELKLSDNETFKANNYSIEYENGIFLVVKAIPKFDIPKNIEVESGTTLKDIVLPEGFTWQEDLNTIVEENGNKKFKCKFTPRDTEHYRVVTEELEVKIKSNLEVNIENYILENDDKNNHFIRNIEVNTTIEKLLQNVKTNGKITILKENNIISSDEYKLETGMKLKIYFGSEIYEYTIVVKGDTDGDGKSDIKDILNINKHRLNKKMLENAYLKAGDVNKDNIVDIKDIFLINKYRLGKINSF